ncbi:hypothetical protein [Parasynechococcus sp.]|uniref:hypothetical protein n=1 Tax=Parasynechococcus sp. TaxID=3101203 RepID=UPI00370483D3
MTRIQRLLLIPCLAPLVLVLLVSVVQDRRPQRLNLLLWTSPALPIGAWTAMASLTGAGLSVGGVLLLRSSGPSLRRTQRFHPGNVESSSGPASFDAERRPEPRQAMPERDIRDPAPTVAVAYRVVQRPSSAPQPKPSPAAASRPPVHESDEQWGEDPDQDW